MQMANTDWLLCARLLQPIFGIYDLLVDTGKSRYEIWKSNYPDSLPTGPAFRLFKGGLPFPYGNPVEPD